MKNIDGMIKIKGFFLSIITFLINFTQHLKCILKEMF